MVKTLRYKDERSMWKVPKLQKEYVYIKNTIRVLKEENKKKKETRKKGKRT